MRTNSRGHGRCNGGEARGERGVLLIDTLVSVALFAVIIVVVVGALASMIDANSKTRATRTVVDNVNAAIESMGRTIRSGTTYHCGSASSPAEYATAQACPSGASVFAVEAAGGDTLDVSDQVVYRLNGSTIERSLQSGNGGWEPLTAPEVVVEELFFQPITFSGSSGEQPKVLITVRMIAGDRTKTDSELVIQTTVAQRLRIVSSQQEASGGSNNPGSPICPFESAPGRYFVNLEVGKNPGSFVHDGSTPGCRITLGPYVPEFNPDLGDSIIPAGTYDVHLVAFDTHCDTWPNCPPDPFHSDQAWEVYRMEFRDQSMFTAQEGDCVSTDDFGTNTDGCSDDIPTTLQQSVTDIGEITFPTDVTGNIWAHHGFSCYDGSNPNPSGTGAHSVVPACVVFDDVNTSQSQTSIEIIDF